ncbi:MAG: hypothetical protein D6719_05990 [Candidatus Dadabacteria bacterium]|nr:MAG: hypothetical protein D6719_05990 [Candidatus Dadabacteria bacterium]
MKILEQINSHAHTAGVDFLVIGGHALNALGFSRQTGDLDLIVSKSDKEFWIKLVSDLGYKQVQTHEVFARFKPAALVAWPVDLMFVEPNVFAQLLSEAGISDFGCCKVKIPSIRHMLALKLHALKQRQKHREGKDVVDVIELLKLGNIAESTFRQLCEKYDRLDLYERLKEYCKSG